MADGLPAPGVAEVLRDPWGVPCVRAGDELSLARAQGEVTAHDRAWQLETDRWRAEGRLAEHLGPAGLDWDVFARRVRLADTAARAHAALGADDRAFVAAHVRGVDAGLARARASSTDLLALDALPGRTPAPTPWPAWGPLGVMLVNHVLFSNLPSLLWREHVARSLGEGALVAFDADGGPGSGSTAWAGHGSRTATGAPLVGGDPHRVLELPGPYQQVRLVCPGVDVVGLAFPGVPGVAHFGHTGDAAWGVTNAVAHTAGVFRERLRRVPGGVEALGPDGWEPVERAVEVIAVRGAEPVEVEVLETARGPVVVGGPDDEVACSVRLPARVDADLGFAALRPLLRARTAEDVVAAFTHWVDPVDRVLAADRGGRVLSWTAGRVPRSTPAARRLPVDAWSPEAARAVAGGGPVALPDPQEVTGAAVDANERPRAAGHDLGGPYAPPHRARRARQLLDAGAGVVDDAVVAALGADVLAGGADELITRLDPPDPAWSAAAAARAEQLRTWDRRMDADGVDAAAFAAWRTALVRRAAADPCLAPLRSPHLYGALLGPWMSVEGRIGDALPQLLAAADRGVLPIDAGELVRLALEDVAALPPPPPWGTGHRLHPLHLLAEVPGAPLTTLASVPSTALAGDTECLRCHSSVPGVSDLSWRGSVARWVWDLGDRERSRWVVPFGASGEARSPHLADQTAVWAAGGALPVVTDPDRLVPDPDALGGPR